MLRLQWRDNHPGAERRQHTCRVGAKSGDSSRRGPIFSASRTVHSGRATRSTTGCGNASATAASGGIRTGDGYRNSAFAVGDHPGIPFATRRARLYTTSSAERGRSVSASFRSGRCSGTLGAATRAAGRAFVSSAADDASPRSNSAADANAGARRSAANTPCGPGAIDLTTGATRRPARSSTYYSAGWFGPGW